MGLKMSVLKTILALLNTLLALLGIGLIALSVFELNASTPNTIEHVAIVVQIFIGSFVILTSFLGCFDTCRSSLGLTWTYAICILILLAFQLYIIIAAHSTDYVRNASEEFESLWRNRTTNSGPGLRDLQQKFWCCGRNGTQDYTLHGGAIPKECYRDQQKSAENLFRDGCLLAVEKSAAKSADIGLTIKWTLFVIELLALGTTALLGISIRNKQRRDQF